MNSGALNSIALNGAVGEIAVRVQLMARARAVASLITRVIVNGRVQAVARAQALGPLAKVFAPVIVEIRAGAQASGLLGRTSARLRVLVRATARPLFTNNVARAFINAVARAVAIVEARAFVRVGASALARAVASGPVGRISHRGVVGAFARVAAVARATVFERNRVRAPVQSMLTAVGVARSSVFVRATVATTATAIIRTASNVRVSPAVQAEARAVVAIDFNVGRRSPFDETAPDNRLLTVSAGPQPFFVVS